MLAYSQIKVNPSISNPSTILVTFSVLLAKSIMEFALSLSFSVLIVFCPTMLVCFLYAAFVRTLQLTYSALRHFNVKAVHDDG